jgi:hypothetical protein
MRENHNTQVRRETSIIDKQLMVIPKFRRWFANPIYSIKRIIFFLEKSPLYDDNSNAFTFVINLTSLEYLTLNKIEKNNPHRHPFVTM